MEYILRGENDMKLAVSRLRRIVAEEIEVVGGVRPRSVPSGDEAGIRELVREALLFELTVGDVRNAISYLRKTKSREKAMAAIKAAGDAAAGVALDGLSGGGASIIKNIIIGGMSLASMIKAAKDVDPKVKKQNPMWDALTIDPDTSAIVDDGVENAFINKLAQDIDGRMADEELPDADVLLNDYLKGKYSGAHIDK